MKRILFILSVLALAETAFAQTAQDALMISQEAFEGTARTVAMGNAFTALGGDVASVSINPAGSGVMRSHQFSITPSLTSTPFSASYLNNLSDGSGTRFTFSNIGFVSCFDTRNYTGLLNYNFSVVYNKKACFNSLLNVSGSTDETSMLASIGASVEGIHSKDLETGSGYNPYISSTAPWRAILAWNTYGLSTLKNIDKDRFPDADDEYVAANENFDPETKEAFIGDYLDQSYSRSTTGGIQEYAFNLGMNFNDMLYLGVNLNMDAVRYEENEYYSETARNPSAFQDGFKSMSTDYWRQTVGTGINFKFGVIFTPADGLRLGATITTPTWYTLHDTWNYRMSNQFNNGKSYNLTSETGVFNYRVTAPVRFSLGFAYTFGNSGLISIDYERANYSATRLADERNNTSSFSWEMNYISKNAVASNILRIGTEARLGSKFSIRGGYIFSGAAESNAPNVNTWSCGLGYRISKICSFDLAYQNTNMGKTSFTLYDDYHGLDAPAGTFSRRQGKVLCTFSVRF